MKTYILIHENGSAWEAQTTDVSKERLYAPADAEWFELDKDGQLIDEEAGGTIDFPQKFSAFDWPTKQWLPDLNAAREARRREVAAELHRRLYLPCNGFDADEVSRGRISGTIARIQRGDGLPAGWIGWRDADNAMHWAENDAQTVLEHLTALARAIEDREQALLIAAWAHKAALEALADIDEVLGYDVTADWPG